MIKFALIAARHWKPLLGLNLVVLAAAAYASTTVPEVWTAKSALILPNKANDLNADLGTLGQIKGGDSVVVSPQLNTLKILGSIMTSNDSLKSVRDRDPEKALYTLGEYKELFEVSPQLETTVINVEVKGSSREVAKERARIFVETFQSRLNYLRKDDAGRRGQFIDKELEEARQNLDRTQSVLAQFREATNLVDSPSQTQQLVAAINTLNNSQMQTSAQAQASATKVQVLSARLQLTPEQAIRSLSLGENQDYQSVRKKLSEVETLLVETRSRFLDQHPQTQILLFQQEQLRRQLEGYVAQATVNNVSVNTSIGKNSGELLQQLILTESDARAQYQQANQLRSQAVKLSEDLRALPTKQAQLAELQRQYDTANGVHNGLIAKVQESKLNAFSTYPSVQVLDQPSAASKPSSSGQQIVILGAILASVLGSLALALLLDGRNPLLKPRDIQAVEVPVLGRVPRLKHPIADTKLESTTEFQRLASAISMLQLQDRRLIISSASLSEGKTTVTTGLAIALNTLGFKVLVVDGDFGRAELSRSLGCAPQGMLHDTLMPSQIRPGLDILSIMPEKGKVAEFIARGRFEQCLSVAEASGDYDYVLIDSAPVSLTSETILMAAVIPKILFVVCPGTSRNSFNDSIEQLAQSNAEIVGLVVNRVEAQSTNYAYKHSGV